MLPLKHLCSRSCVLTVTLASLVAALPAVDVEGDPAEPNNDVGFENLIDTAPGWSATGDVMWDPWHDELAWEDDGSAVRDWPARRDTTTTPEDVRPLADYDGDGIVARYDVDRHGAAFDNYDRSYVLDMDWGWTDVADASWYEPRLEKIFKDRDPNTATVEAPSGYEPDRRDDRTTGYGYQVYDRDKDYGWVEKEIDFDLEDRDVPGTVPSENAFWDW